MTTIQQVQSVADFQKLLTSDKLVVVDFFATWCGPCKMIAPFYAQLSTKYKQAVFAKVDVDQLKEVAAACKVTSMPTFQFYKNGNKVAEMKGANPQQLEHYVKQHAGETASSSSKKSFSIPGCVDLTEYITPNQMDALNQQEKNNVKNIFKDDVSYLESDVDEQLIISVPFNQPVKLHSLQFKVPCLANAPKTVKIYANRTVLGFDDADAVKETQVLELKPEHFEQDAIVNLRFVKYQNITHIMLFIEDNQEDEETTKIQQLVFIGSPVEATNMSDFNKEQ
ncbi:PITH domain-containing protein [Gilbertella persicaria]|uniref:PITH domain-containing protein n=1 Tax=Gilbertella persicaria TaxID=101096 RepID=UPI00221EC0E6|nr:PITH domain-containing protein [Gilbertella persicaria]KAI8062803.1 PITH domain-containing protein [Gilbertella persicaria]